MRCIIEDKRTRGIMAESSSVFHHIMSFRNLCETYDIDDNLKDILKHHKCDSVVALTHISEADREAIVKSLTVGYRSRINAAILELNKWPRPGSRQSLPAIETHRSLDVSKINHEKDFNNFCVKHNVKQESVDILSKHDCDSLPALRHLPKTELNNLLWKLSEGQRAAVTQGIRELREIPHSMSLPELSKHAQEEPVYPKRAQLISNDENLKRNNSISNDLYRQIGDVQDFEDIKRAARSFLDPRDLAACYDIRGLCDFLMKRGVIEMDNYTNLIKILKEAKLPILQKIVENKSREIQEKRDKEEIKHPVGREEANTGIPVEASDPGLGTYDIHANDMGHRPGQPANDGDTLQHRFVNLSL